MGQGSLTIYVNLHIHHVGGLSQVWRPSNFEDNFIVRRILQYSFMTMIVSICIALIDCCYMHVCM